MNNTMKIRNIELSLVPTEDNADSEYAIRIINTISDILKTHGITIAPAFEELGYDVYVESKEEAHRHGGLYLNENTTVIDMSQEKKKNTFSMHALLSMKTNLPYLDDADDELYARLAAVGIDISDSADEEFTDERGKQLPCDAEDAEEMADMESNEEDDEDDDTQDIHEENVDPDWCKVPNETAPNQYKSNPSTKYPNASFVYNPDVIKEATEHAEEILGGHTFSKKDPWYFPVYLKVFVRDEEACIRNHSYGLCDVLEFEALENLRTDLKKLSTSELQTTIIDRLSDAMRKSIYGFNPENFTCGVFLWGRN